jgi:hypothetical protein
MSPPIILGSVCDEWDYTAKSCVSQATVYQLPGTAAAYFLTKMAIDADGAPKAYYPGEYYPSNSHQAFDWLDNLNVNDQHGVQGADASAPGFLVSGTALTDTAHYPSNDTHCYVDASSIPYIVLTGGTFPTPNSTGLQTGALAFVVDTRTGNYSGAIYADVGRAVGEASLALALMLSIDPFSKRYWPKVTGGVTGRVIFYLVFPKVIIPPPWDVKTIQQSAYAEFQAWGDEPALNQLFPAMPKMSGPRPIIIRPPVQIQDFDANDDATNERIKGSDISKEQLNEL